MDANLRQQQNAIVNATPLPVADPTTDVLDTIPLADDGPAPVDDGAATDDHSWMTGGTFVVKDQAEWDALPEERKEVVRAAMAMGGKLPMADAMAIYKTSLRARVESEPRTVALPDGRTVYKVGQQIIDPLEAKKKEIEIQKALEEQERAAAQEGEKNVFLSRINEYRGWVKGGGIVGPGADIRQQIDSLANPDSYTKRWKLGTVIGEQVLENIKRLGSNPSDAERKFLLEIQPKITDPAAVWDEYFNTLEGVIGRRVGATKGAGLPAAAAPAASYSSPVDVRAAYKAGKISRDEALRMISGMGGR
jgi:hypothetical protein